MNRPAVLGDNVKADQKAGADPNEMLKERHPVQAGSDSGETAVENG